MGNVDGVDGPDYAGKDGNQDPLNLLPTRYVADNWYPDDNSQMLADFAMYNYVNDLQPGVDNQVGHAGDDIAFWQHLNMFTVGLGLFGAWLAMFADLVVRGGFFLHRFAGGRWQEIKV